MKIGTPEFRGTKSKDVLQSLQTLFTTTAGSVVLDREFGIDPSIIDMPIPSAMNSYAVEAAQKVDRYEPRVIVDEVTWETSAAEEGEINPVIHVQDNEYYDGGITTVADDGHMYDFWDNELGG